MRLVVLTGLSGAGKTQALHALEDIGYYCVDNLPPSMLPTLADLCTQARPCIERVAVGVDVRGGSLFSGVEGSLDILHTAGVDVEILFLDASDAELIRRYKETRRTHPFGNEAMMQTSIERERTVLTPLLHAADRIINTTGMLPRELRESVNRLYGVGVQDTLRVSVLSFGYKRGIPQEADLVLDVRFLPNPFYFPEMRALTGLDAPVSSYIASFPETQEFIDKTLALMGFLLPRYASEGKTRQVLAVGCTGGQHRSVYLSERLGEGLRALGYQADIAHRDKP